MITCTLLGSGGTKPLPNNYLTALYVNVENSAILIDCGEGTQVALSSAKVKTANLDVICLTHFHTDHVLGLPGLLSSINLAYKVESHKRKTPLTILCPRGTKDNLQNLLNLVNCSFPIVVYEVSGEFNSIEFPQFTIEAIRLNHDITCYGYCVVETVNSKFNYEKVLINEVPEESWKFLQAGYQVMHNNNLLTSSDISNGPPRENRVLYATDTTYTPNLVKYVKYPKLAILDGMYGTESQRSSKFYSKHLTFAEAAYLAEEMKASELWLTHFSPTNCNPESFLHLATGIFKNTRCGFAGLRKEVL